MFYQDKLFSSDDLEYFKINSSYQLSSKALHNAVKNSIPSHYLKYLLQYEPDISEIYSMYEI